MHLKGVAVEGRLGALLCLLHQFLHNAALGKVHKPKLSVGLVRPGGWNDYLGHLQIQSMLTGGILYN